MELNSLVLLSNDRLNFVDKDSVLITVTYEPINEKTKSSVNSKSKKSNEYHIELYTVLREIVINYDPKKNFCFINFYKLHNEIDLTTKKITYSNNKIELEDNDVVLYEGLESITISLKAVALYFLNKQMMDDFITYKTFNMIQCLNILKKLKLEMRELYLMTFHPRYDHYYEIITDKKNNTLSFEYFFINYNHTTIILACSSASMSKIFNYFSYYYLVYTKFTEINNNIPLQLLSDSRLKILEGWKLYRNKSLLIRKELPPNLTLVPNEIDNYSSRV